jgi:nitrogen regulatory protein PII
MLITNLLLLLLLLVVLMPEILFLDSLFPKREIMCELLIGTWNVRTLNRGCKLENLKEMEKNEVSVMGVSEVRWKGQGETRSGDYAMYYSGGEKSEIVVAIVVHKSTVGSVVKKIVCNDRIIAV